MDLIEKADNSNRHPWELARVEVVQDILKQTVNNYHGKNVLDLGCGDLFFIEEFSKDKPHTKFYAVDTAFTDVYIENYSRATIQLAKSIEQFSVNKDFHLDIVFLMDVIEHIEDDLGFLQNLLAKGFISKKTIFIITVPAYQQLFCSHDVFLKHYRRYTQNTLGIVIQNAGMTTVDKGYFFFSLLLPRLFEVLKEIFFKPKSFSSGTRLTKWKQGSFLTNSLKKVLITDYKIQKLLKKTGLGTPGLSTYVVCKRLT